MPFRLFLWLQEAAGIVLMLVAANGGKHGTASVIFGATIYGVAVYQRVRVDEAAKLDQR